MSTNSPLSKEIRASARAKREKILALKGEVSVLKESDQFHTPDRHNFPTREQITFENKEEMYSIKTPLFNDYHEVGVDDLSLSLTLQKPMHMPMLQLLSQKTAVFTKLNRFKDPLWQQLEKKKVIPPVTCSEYKPLSSEKVRFRPLFGRKENRKYRFDETRVELVKNRVFQNNINAENKLKEELRSASRRLTPKFTELSQRAIPKSRVVVPLKQPTPEVTPVKSVSEKKLNIPKPRKRADSMASEIPRVSPIVERAANVDRETYSRMSDPVVESEEEESFVEKSVLLPEPTFEQDEEDESILDLPPMKQNLLDVDDAKIELLREEIVQVSQILAEDTAGELDFMRAQLDSKIEQARALGMDVDSLISHQPKVQPVAEPVVDHELEEKRRKVREEREKRKLRKEKEKRMHEERLKNARDDKDSYQHKLEQSEYAEILDRKAHKKKDSPVKAQTPPRKEKSKKRKEKVKIPVNPPSPVDIPMQEDPHDEDMYFDDHLDEEEEELYNAMNSKDTYIDGGVSNQRFDALIERFSETHLVDIEPYDLLDDNRMRELTNSLSKPKEDLFREDSEAIVAQLSSDSYFFTQMLDMDVNDLLPINTRRFGIPDVSKQQGIAFTHSK
ncbi:hypothetical protein PCE1_001975 [Barthelona sp. PCE]